MIPCPGVQLEFHIKITAPGSVTTEITNAVAVAREALANLSPPSAIQMAITVKDDGAEILGEAETAEEALSPIAKTIDVGAFMEKVEMFLNIVDVISEVRRSFYWAIAHLIVCKYSDSPICEDGIVAREGSVHGE